MKVKFLFLFLFLFLVGCNNQTTLNTTETNQPTSSELEALAVEFRVSEGMLQWKYESDVSWNDIYSLDNLNGIGIESAVINSEGELVITYSDDSIDNLGKFNDLHLVQFLDGEGRVLSVQLIRDGEAAIAPDIPSLVGHYFAGWDKEFDEVLEDLGIVPYFFYEFYTAYLNENGGSEVGNYGTDYGIPVDLPVPERPGYVFLGWYYGLEAQSPKFENGTVLTSDVTLYAHWQKTNSINVKTEEEFLEALNNEAYEAIYFDNDIEVYDTINLTRSVEIYGNGYNLLSKNLNKLFRIKSDFSLGTTPNMYPNGGKLLISDLDIVVDHGIEYLYSDVIFDFFEVDNFKLHLDKVDIIGNVNNGIKLEMCDGFEIRYLNGNIDVLQKALAIYSSMQFDLFIDNAFLTAINPIYIWSIGSSALRIEDTEIVSKLHVAENAGITVGTGSENYYSIKRTKFSTFNNVTDSFAMYISASDPQSINLESVEIQSFGNSFDKVFKDDLLNTQMIASDVTLIIEGVDDIPDQAFQNKHVFSHIVLTEGLETIGHLAFASNSKLQSINIPQGVEWIGDMAFSSCFNLYSVIIPNSVTYLGSEVFSGSSPDQFIYIEEGYNKTGWESNWNGGDGTSESNIQGYEIIDGVTYVILNDNDVKVIDYINYGVKDIDIPETIEFGEGNYTVKEIGNYAFYYNYTLTSVEIPQTVTYIGKGAFKLNLELRNVDFIGQSQLRVIGEAGFSGCSKLESIYLPDSLEQISNQAFAYNYKLEVVDFGENPQMTVIYQSTFFSNENLRSITIPDSVIEIRNSAFYNCLRLSEINLSESSQLVSIGPSAFTQNYSLEYFYLPASVTTISDNAFLSCFSLSSFEIDESSQLETLGIWVFGNNLSLEAINLPDSVTSIGSSAFQNCDSLEYFLVPLGLTIISTGLFKDCENLEVVEFKENSQVTEIDTMAFSGCKKLFATNLPDTLITIGYKSFFGNINLEVIYIPDSVTTIEAYAFSGCINLSEVLIEHTSTLATVGDYAFEECDSLAEFYVPITVTFMGVAVFYNCDNITVNVVAASMPSVWNTNWSIGVTTIVWGYVPS